MKNLYDSLINKLRQELNLFRIQSLLGDILKGGCILLLFVVCYLLLYYFIISCFNITIAFKTAMYVVYGLAVTGLMLYFMVYPLIRFFLSLNLGKNILQNKVLGTLEGGKDVFISLYELAFNSVRIGGDESLKAAAFVQKYHFLQDQGIAISFPKKLLLRYGVVMLVLLSVLSLNNSFFHRLHSDIVTYGEVNNPRLKIDFLVVNESLEVEYGKPFRLELTVNSEHLSITNVFICFGGGEFLMDAQDSLFVYDFDVVNNDIGFYFKTAGIESRAFKIKVLPTPEITDYQVSYTPPAYTGLKNEVLKNIVDFRVLYGSSLHFDIEFSELDSLFLQSADDVKQIALKSKSKAQFTHLVRNSGEYTLYGSNSHFSRKNLINFTISCIPDLYPGIQLTEMQDSLRTSFYYFYGVISDDFGFSDLRFNYSINGKTVTVMPIDVIKNTNTQEFYFNFDFSEFAGMDNAKINYYFEVFDNDAVSGYKSTRSDEKNYLVPDLNTIFDYNLKADNNVNSSLKEAEKLAKDIVSGVKDLQKKLLESGVDNWEKQQLAKDVVEKKSKLDKLLSEVKEANQKKSSLNKSFTKQDSLLLDKQERIQELMDKIMDDEMKKLMEEFSKLSQEFSKDKFQNLDEKMKLSFEQMSEELDRNIELLKRFQIEERHDMLSQQLDKLKENQKTMGENQKTISKDSLTQQSKDINKKFDNLEENYKNLLEENKSLEEPYQLKDMKKEFNELSEMLNKQDENSSAGKPDEKLSKDIEEKMEEMAEQMEEQQEQNFMQTGLPENDIELIIQNILIISLSQEELLNEFPKASPQSVRYNELGRIQDLKKLQYKIVKDSLSVLAKSNLMLASILSDKFYAIEIKFGLLPGYIQDNKPGELKREQQYIITYLNDMALSLAQSLEQSKKGSQGSGSGSKSKKGSKPGNDKGNGNQDGYGEMKKMQNGIKKQLEDLVSKMKNGEKGKPLQQGISKMIREQEMFRQSLNEFISENGSLSNSEKQLLNEINKLLEENIKDIANYSISNNLVNRNNQIYSKLLMSEKASKEREEYEEKRKSTTAEFSRYARPETFFDYKKKESMVKTNLQKSDIKLNGFFKNMYNNYYIKLGNE